MGQIRENWPKLTHYATKLLKDLTNKQKYGDGVTTPGITIVPLPRPSITSENQTHKHLS